MKLDVECVRDVLLELESLPMGAHSIYSLKKSIELHGQDNVIYTVAKLTEARYINADVMRMLDGKPSIQQIFDITYNGHEFLNSIRKPDVWDRLKGAAVECGTAGLKMLGEIGYDIGKQYLEHKFGLSG